MNSRSELHTLLHRNEIETAVKRLAAEISEDYQGKFPLLIGVLKGSFMFMTDLVRLLDFPLEVEFIRLSSYGREKQSSGRIKFLLNYLRKKKPASLKLCSLTDKPSRREVPVAIDYLGFTVPNKFLVGYGLDYNEEFRNLPDICVLKE